MLESVLPGRIRVRLPQHLAHKTQDTIRTALDKAAAGSCMEYNPRSGSLLVTWQSSPKRDAAVRKVLETHMASEMHATQEAHPAASPLGTGLARVSELAKGVNIPWPAMKTVKKGMLISLGTALTALAFKSERIHYLAGGTFVALLLRHVHVYRRRMFK
ncbi:MAG: hypothetical protein ACLGSA_15065 [Acidobacteriota bacterium]